MNNLYQLVDLVHIDDPHDLQIVDSLGILRFVKLHDAQLAKFLTKAQIEETEYEAGKGWLLLDNQGKFVDLI
jgi:hypothetical protein